MEVEQTYGDRVNIVGVPGLADVNEMQRFVMVRGVDGIPHIADVDGDLWDRFGVIRQRTYVLVNDDGSFEMVGYGSIEEEIEALIAR